VDQSADAVGGWDQRGGIGVGFVHIVRSLYSERGDRFFMLRDKNCVLSPNKPQTNAQFKDTYCGVAANPQIYT
jgi:hypothetical protein